MKKKILLTGASGIIGKEVLKQLVKSDNLDVTVFDLKTEKSVKLFSSYKDKINVVYGDITDTQELEKVTFGLDSVIHLAAVTPPLADANPKSASDVNIHATDSLLNLLQKNSPNAFFLYGSSIVVYGDRVACPMIRTTDPLEPSDNDYYANTRIKAERAIQRSSLKWSIFRTSDVIVYDDYTLNGSMFEMPMETSLEMITPQDAGRAFAYAVEKKDKLNKLIFNLGGGQGCRDSYKGILNQVFKIYGLGKLDYPEHAFAKRNYHGGFYADGDILQDILSFREDTLESYFLHLRKHINPVKRFVFSLMRKPVKRFMLTQSVPYEAYKTNDKTLVQRFFYHKTAVAYS